MRKIKFLAAFGTGSLLLAAVLLGQASKPQQQKPGLGRPSTPIQHVIVIIGENHSFDNLFGVYQATTGQTVSNLLTKGIVNADGTPGPNYVLAVQKKASDPTNYQLNPVQTGPWPTLPPPNTSYAPTKPFFMTVNQVLETEPGLLPQDAHLLTIGGTNLPNDVVDRRFPANLPAGPFQITKYVSYHAYIGDSVHRFYQMWQQADCNALNATPQNPTGCTMDLYPYVGTTIGTGSNGDPQPKPFNVETTNNGGNSMGFYNMSMGDAPYFKSLAQQYSISDNYHQVIEGGTGPNHVAIGTGDAVWYSDGHGHPLTPPQDEIEDPNPQPGTNNWYTQDGYSGGTYSNCSDLTQPGVAQILDFEGSLSYQPWNQGNCAPSTYYLLNNYNPGYNNNGTINTAPFTIPPSSVRTIGDELAANHLSWNYFGEGFNPGTPLSSLYCNICNPFQYATSIMTTSLINNLLDIEPLYADILNGTLPAVSIVKPDGYLDGHPASSKPELFEAFVRKIVTEVQANPKLWQHTAIFITVDESGGAYDSGYVQPIDFFGDGPRIPLIVVSPYAKGGRVNHSYADHVSILKFIERNWGLPPITNRSIDNLPNPVLSKANPYAPSNSPAISDLMDMFRFGKGAQTK
jgi:phospholipase C